MTATVIITSFGELHGSAPRARRPIEVDLSRALRNPHRDPQMRYLTGMDRAVRDHVMSTPGARGYVDDTVERVTRRLAESSGPVEVHVWCRGGRHRSVSIAEETAARLRASGVQATVEHRDIDKPVVQK